MGLTVGQWRSFLQGTCITNTYNGVSYQEELVLFYVISSHAEYTTAKVIITHYCSHHSKLEKVSFSEEMPTAQSGNLFRREVQLSCPHLPAEIVVLDIIRNMLHLDTVKNACPESTRKQTDQSPVQNASQESTLIPLLQQARALAKIAVRASTLNHLHQQHASNAFQESIQMPQLQQTGALAKIAMLATIQKQSHQPHVQNAVQASTLNHLHQRHASNAFQESIQKHMHQPPV